MDTKKSVSFLAFLLFFALVLPVHAAKTGDSVNRYFIKSTTGLWKNSLGVRHVFEDGFTAEASDWQIRVAKLFGVDAQPVSRLVVLADAVSDDAGAPELAAAPGTQKPLERFIPSATTPWGVRMMYNDAEGTPRGGKDVTVAVLDTGVLKTHPDLVRRVSDCKDFTGVKDPVADGRCDDKNGHGTHVAGIIAADGGKDTLGVYGVAPEASLLAYKVCDDEGVCWADDVAVAIRTAVDNGAHIINISLGSDTTSGLVRQAVQYATAQDVLVVAAAGNDGPYEGGIDYPASFSEVVGVGAVGSTRAIPDWSSRGMNDGSELGAIEEGDIELVAPAVSIESTWKNGGYAVVSGTSMAAAHISGLAAKLWKSTLTHPAAEVRSVLHKITYDIAPEGEDSDSGFGIPSVNP